MRKLAVAVVSMMVLAGSGVALASNSSWPTVKVTPKVTPSKAGTPKHPKGVKLTTIFHWQTLGALKQPIVAKFNVWFPHGSLYNGGKVKSCSSKKIKRGPSACPKGSIVGSGTGTAYAGTTKTHPKITVVNGGKKTVYFWTVLNNPARVREPVVGHIKKVSGKYAYELSVTVPMTLRIVAGTPIELTYLKVNAGKKNWLATTSCSGGKWPFKVTTYYAKPGNPGHVAGSASDSSSVACTK